MMQWSNMLRSIYWNVHVSTCGWCYMGGIFYNYIFMLLELLFSLLKSHYTPILWWLQGADQLKKKITLVTENSVSKA